MGDEELFMMGKNDAKRYYRPNSAMLVTAGTTFLFAPLGIVQGAISASKPPKVRESKVSNTNYLTHNSFISGYQQQGKKIKKKKILKGFGIAAAVFVVSISSN